MQYIETSLSLIKQNTVDLILEDELLARLKLGKALHIKAGFDPTAPDLHIGHTILLNKLRQFQDLGHKVTFLVGDFTGIIGDPTGKNSSRKQLLVSEILANAATYKEQAFKILDPKNTNVVFNSTWFSKMNISSFIELVSKSTVARMLERDDFRTRYCNGQPISLHELIYPLMQGYDSVVLNADIEIGGTDQKFNLLLGRELQKHFNQLPQIVITMPILEGLDGIQKMSKSLNNYIGINDEPNEMFGKIMSISDNLMWRYIDLLSFRQLSEIKKWKEETLSGNLNPRDIKLKFAEEIVERFYNKEIAYSAKKYFIDRFTKKILINSKKILVSSINGVLPITNLLKDAGLVTSTSEAFRLIRQGAIKIDGERIFHSDLKIKAGSEHTYQVGKLRIARILLT